MNRNEANAAIKRTNIRGKQYAEVNQRILAFWEIFPNGSIITEMLSDDGERCVFKATAYDKDMPMATGHAFEVRTASNINKTSYLENCETSAVGRALGMLGIGAEDAICSAEEVNAAIAQQGSQGRYKAPSDAAKGKKAQEKNNGPQECTEYAEMLKAFSDYCEKTGEPKADAWKRFHGCDAGKDDPEYCRAVMEDLSRALGGGMTNLFTE